MPREFSRLHRTGEIEQVYDKWFGSLGLPSTLLQAMHLLNGLPE